MKTKLDLKAAQDLAGAWISAIAARCERVEVAGSVRRRSQMVGDIDIVCIPKRVLLTSLFGEGMGERNLAHEHLQGIVEMKRNCTWERGGDAPGKLCTIIVDEPPLKYAVDFYFTTPEKWGAVFLTRTGPDTHNIWLSKRAKELGGDWSAAAGLYLPGKGARIGSEEALIYSALGLPFVDPRNRAQIETIAHDHRNQR